MTEDATPFATGHVGLNVTSIKRSTGFYREVFGFDVIQESPDAHRPYVFLGYDGKILLTLWEQCSGSFATDCPGLHHLAFQVDSMDLVHKAVDRLRSMGATIYHDGIVAHNENSGSGGVFFQDPDGIRLEIYARTGLTKAVAPTPGAPTCGFF